MTPFQEPGLSISDCPDALDTGTIFFVQAVSRACRASNVLVTKHDHRRPHLRDTLTAFRQAVPTPSLAHAIAVVTCVCSAHDGARTPGCCFRSTASRIHPTRTTQGRFARLQTQFRHRDNRIHVDANSAWLMRSPEIAVPTIYDCDWVTNSDCDCDCEQCSVATSAPSGLWQHHLDGQCCHKDECRHPTEAIVTRTLNQCGRAELPGLEHWMAACVERV